MAIFFIIFPTATDKIENLVTDRKSGEGFIKDIIMIFDRLDCEKHIEVFIDIENKKKFIDDFNALVNLMEVKITIGSFDLEDVINNLIFGNAIKFSSNPYYDYKIEIIDGFQKIDRIFKDEINQSRVLNRNDFRHCENHPNRIPTKSPLIGGIGGFNNAEKWLPSAIGDAKTKKTIVINIDLQNGNFIIRFEDENFNNQYHAYHIVKGKDGNYTEDNEKLKILENSSKGIPRALKLIKYRNQLSSK